MPKTITEATVVGQQQLSATVKLIEVIAPEIAAQALPGQFVNVRVSKGTAPLLRRPFGVAGVCREHGTFTMIYRVLGEGTQLLAELCSGDRLSIVGPLGNGFATGAAKPLLVGGGLGLAPLLYLAAALDGACDVLMGGHNADELFWTELYEQHSSNIYLTTDDGSAGTKGTVMALLPELLAGGGYDRVYVCGPVPMMKAVAGACLAAGVPCQVSLEKYMACGLGACLSCACEGVGRRLKICKDGPVFWAGEVGEW